MKKRLSYYALLSTLLLTATSCGVANESTPTTSTPTESAPVSTPAVSESAPEVSESTPTEVTIPDLVEQKVTLEKKQDTEIYENALPGYDDMIAVTKTISDDDERFITYAKVEAYLLNQAVMVPNTTNGGAYTLSRVAPRTIPYVSWGVDDKKFHSMVVADKFIPKADRDTLIAQWKEAKGVTTEYDPAAWLKANGYEVKKEYATTFTSGPNTLDMQSSSKSIDVEYTCNTIDGLVEYNNLGQMEGRQAESWEISEDGTKITFKLRKGMKWYDSEGNVYGDCTADDYVAGFQHMLDAGGGLSYLVDGVVKGALEYDSGEEEDFSKVGVTAVDDYTLEIELEEACPYFMTMLTYSIFMPMNRQFYVSKGGVFGKAAYKAIDASTYNYGKTTDISSMCYNGPYLFGELTTGSKISLVRNTKYWDNANTTLDKISFIYDDGSNPKASYDAVIAGTYVGTGLSSTTLAYAKEDGNFDHYAYTSDTDSTTYFGNFNLNRQTYDATYGGYVSSLTEEEQTAYFNAVQSASFRRAIAFAWDRKTQNAVSRGTELAATNLRNMYTYPELVSLSKSVTAYGHTFAQGTSYGDLVQYFLVTDYDSHINVADGQDGYYDVEAAQAELAKYEELYGEITTPIKMEMFYYGASTTQSGQAAALKKSIEESLGGKVVVVTTSVSSVAEYYYSGYYCDYGYQCDYDFYYGSGWGPDYGDPSTYLDTFTSYGYMTMLLGIDNA